MSNSSGIGTKVGLGTFGIDENDLSSPINPFADIYISRAIERGRTALYYPISPLSDLSDPEFIVPASSLEYIHLPKTRLLGKFKVVKTDTEGKSINLDADDDISLINLAPSSLFKLMDFKLNNEPIADVSSYGYAFKQFIETSLSFNQDSKKKLLKKCLLYLEDTPGKEGAIDKTDETHSYHQRKEFIKNSREVEFAIPLHVDLIQCPKYLLPGMNISVKLLRQSDDFVLLGPSKTRKITGNDGTEKVYTYQIKLLDLKLSLHYLTLANEIVERHAAILKTKPALYHFPFSRVNNHVITANTKFVPIQHIATGILPNMILFGFIPSANLSPNITKNPYHFGPYNLEQITFKVSGNIEKTYKMNFSSKGNEQALVPYIELHDLLCLSQQNNSLNIPFESFVSGMNFYVFDLTSGHSCNNFHFHEPRVGSVDADLFYNPAPSEIMNMMSYSIFNKTLAIDINRNVKFIEDFNKQN